MKQPSKLFIELTHDTLHSASYVRPFVQEEVDQWLGFRSVYLYGEEAYERIKKQNAVKNLNKYPVFSDTLFVDFDDGDQSIDSLQTILNTAGIGWKMYFSGSKGYHFHIPTTPMWGKYVPYSHKAYVKSLGITTADTSIYKHTGLFRLPGTYHKKTGNQKELVDQARGKLLSIPYLEPETELEVVTGSTGELLTALNCANTFIVSEPGNGSRHNSLLAVAKHMMAAGAEPETAADICRLIHNSWESQYDDPEEKIKEVIDRAYNWQRYSNRPSLEDDGSRSVFG